MRILAVSPIDVFDGDSPGAASESFSGGISRSAANIHLEHYQVKHIKYPEIAGIR